MNIHVDEKRMPNYEKWNQKLNQSWSSADYSKIGTTLQITGEMLAETANLTPGSEVLDVAAGNGNATLAFARRWCQVHSTDYVEAVLVDGERRAQAEGLEVSFEVADAQNMQFADGSFDAVVSTFGSMFAPDQAKTAAEMIRVCKPGGKIAFTSWTYKSFIGRLCPTVGRHMGASSGFKAPANWGSPDWITEHFSATAKAIEITPRMFNFRFFSPEHYLEFFRAYYGLTKRAYEHVGAEGEALLSHQISSR